MYQCKNMSIGLFIWPNSFFINAVLQAFGVFRPLNQKFQKLKTILWTTVFWSFIEASRGLSSGTSDKKTMYHKAKTVDLWRLSKNDPTTTKLDRDDKSDGTWRFFENGFRRTLKKTSQADEGLRRVKAIEQRCAAEMAHTQAGPALACAGPNARPRRGAPLNSGFMMSTRLVNPTMAFLMKTLLQNSLYEYQKRRQNIGVDLYVSYMVSQKFTLYLKGRWHSSCVP